MRILVASQNEIDRVSVEDAYQTFYDGQVPEVVSADREVKHKVDDQPRSIPMGEQEVKSNIDAAKALIPGRFAAIVALEGTCFHTSNGWYETTIAGIRENGRVHFGHGPSFPIPEKFIRLLKQNKTLDDAMKELTRVEEVAETTEFSGWLAGKEYNRRAASSMAVYLALCGMRAEKQ